MVHLWQTSIPLLILCFAQICYDALLEMFDEVLPSHQTFEVAIFFLLLGFNVRNFCQQLLVHVVSLWEQTCADTMNSKFWVWKFKSGAPPENDPYVYNI